MPGRVNDVADAVPRSDGRATRWAGQRERRRAEFVEAALVVIDREGPEAHVSSIAAEAGVGRAVLYRHFADRADLDRAIGERTADLLVDAVTPHLQLPPCATPEELDAAVDAAVVGALDAYLDFVQAHVNLYRFVRMHDADTRLGPVRRVKWTVIARVAAIARDYVLAAGRSPAGTADVLATGLIGLADAAIDRWLDEPGGLGRADLTRTIAVMARAAAEAVAGPVAIHAQQHAPSRAEQARAGPSRP